MGGHDYLCVSGDREGGHPFYLFPGVRHGDRQALVARVRDFLAASFDWDFFPRRLPTLTRNARPALVPATAIRDGYWLAASKDPEVRVGVVADMFAKKPEAVQVDPKHADLVAQPNGEAIWERFFNEWFAVSYLEDPEDEA